VRLAILGVSGRMGRCLVRALDARAELHLVGALAGPGSPAVGEDVGRTVGLDRRFGVAVAAERALALADATVAVDFTLPDATAANVAACVERGCALLIGTTGLDAAAQRAIDAAARRIAVLQAANTSLGVNLLVKLVREAAAALPAAYDVEIVEAHHRDKVDAPSGTALRLGAAAAEGRGGSLDELALEVRDGHTGPRREGAIGFAVVRGGDIVGEHAVLFAGPGERLELAHRAHDRMTFAHGALQAAAWLHGRAPGRYTMADVLGVG
jgi:4-hydroxy-tetrahydrodipicolinate reductase